MRLKSIKLAGFKSFVDPTTVSFPSNMSAVVGPNGCGKSNIIDAVRWVMGESSAKHLRGESMTDVIFNGSNSRKPVSQASIELIFDNSDGTLRGEYAAFAEISIRRQVTRDGQNTYFLNGTRCRRRDITDIFLGTGLGPRSYAIIEQGMISRLIEARPEDLRHFIEEAAGISKYKERRRETETRIRHTQENLARLSDLRSELERQLERLHRQAQTAEKYRQYKAEERQLKAQLSAVRWQQFNEQVAVCEQRNSQQEITFEALLATQRHAEAAIEQLRETHHEHNQAFQQAQEGFYGVSAEIGRLEQSLQHRQQQLNQLKTDLDEGRRQRQEAEAHLEQDQALIAQLDEELAHLEPERELAQEEALEADARLEEAEAALQDWQERWEQFNLHSAEPQRNAEVQQALIQQLEHSLERLAERQRRVKDEQLLLGDAQEEALQQSLEEQLALSQEQLEALSDTEAQLHQQLEGTLAELKQIQPRQQQTQAALQRLEGQISSLEQLWQSSLQPGNGLAEWLAEQQLQQHPKLAECLKAEAGWERALETVLAQDLQALVLEEDFSPLPLEQLQQGELRLIQQHTPSPAPQGSLLEQVQAPCDLSPWLAQVYTAESLAEALERRPHLKDGQSLITREGYWLSRHWLRIQHSSEGQGGLLAQAKNLEQLRAQQHDTEAELHQLSEQLEQLQTQRQQQENAREQQRQQLQQQSRQHSQWESQYSACLSKREQLRLRCQRLEQELAEISEQRTLETEQLGEARLILQEAVDAMAQVIEERDLLHAGRSQLREQLEQLRQGTRQHKDKAQQLAVQLGALRARHSSTLQGLERLRSQRERAQERCEQLSLMLEETAAPQDELHLQLDVLLEQRLERETLLQQTRQTLDEVDQQLRDEEKRRTQSEQQALALRGQLEQQRLETQALHLQRQALYDHLRADGYEVQGVLANLPPEANEPDWVQRLETLGEQIQRLGAINLAAIEEYQQQSERKAYLDAQNADLEEALNTLDSVIRKIDQETRQRFKDTFDQINGGLQNLFPKVFGGGTAWLELTGEDLLDTGVAIMARPPGKKNSTIHLLSGGEKALTALALVFAIFQLNPAPFCMLDEVDAPLDDANVGRYARLVKEMSDRVQFIYISHNKIAMEMADQLMGVTMHEPGCSRLVSVNMEQALAMAE